MESIDATLLNIGNGMVVTRDTSLAALVEESFSLLMSSSEMCMDLERCSLALRRKKFELVVVDCGIGPDATEVIKAVRAAPSTNRAVIVAVTWNKEQAKGAYSSGVTFVVQQPLSKASLRNVSKAAHGPILRERRRYFRCYIEIPIRAYRENRNEWQGMLTNISESGACITAPFRLVPGETLTIEMEIPASPAPIIAQCEVLWGDSRNRAGVHFLALPDPDKAVLQGWLTDRLQRIINLDRSPAPPINVQDRTYHDAYLFHDRLQHR